jgi:zinc transporter ZupT
LGGLGGAALGTPLLVSQDRSVRRDRVWLSGVMLGTVVGAGVGYWLLDSGEESAAGQAASAAPAEGAAQVGAAARGAAPEPRVHVGLGSWAAPLGINVTGEW